MLFSPLFLWSSTKVQVNRKMRSEVNKLYEQAHTHPNYFGTITKNEMPFEHCFIFLQKKILYLFSVATIKRHGHVMK
jgi:hypothetical protein